MFVLGKRYPEIERGKQGYSRDISPLLDVAPTPPLCSGTALLAWGEDGWSVRLFVQGLFPLRRMADPSVKESTALFGLTGNGARAAE